MNNSVIFFSMRLTPIHWSSNTIGFLFSTSRTIHSVRTLIKVFLLKSPWNTSWWNLLRLATSLSYACDSVTSSDDSTEEIHVVLNESNVMDSFFDKKVSKDIFGNGLWSPILRLCESRLQNNECLVESIISMFISSISWSTWGYSWKPSYNQDQWGFHVWSRGILRDVVWDEL